MSRFPAILASDTALRLLTLIPMTLLAFLPMHCQRGVSILQLFRINDTMLSFFNEKVHEVIRLHLIDIMLQAKYLITSNLPCTLGCGTSSLGCCDCLECWPI